MTTFYDNQPQSESLTLEQREQRYQQERWMGEAETVADDWLFAPLPSERVDEYEEIYELEEAPAGTIIYNIETMIKEDFDEEGIPNVYQSQMWSYGELSRDEANEFLTKLNPDLILMSFVQRGDADEF